MLGFNAIHYNLFDTVIIGYLQSEMPREYLSIKLRLTGLLHPLLSMLNGSLGTQLVGLQVSRGHP